MASPGLASDGQSWKGQDRSPRGVSERRLPLSLVEDGETKTEPGIELDFGSAGRNLLDTASVDHARATLSHLGTDHAEPCSHAAQWLGALSSPACWPALNPAAPTTGHVTLGGPLCDSGSLLEKAASPPQGCHMIAWDRDCLAHRPP